MKQPALTGSRRAFLATSLAVCALAQPVTRTALGQDVAVTEILSNSSKRLAEVESLHFTLDVEGETFRCKCNLLVR